MSILTSGGGHAVVNVLVAGERPVGYDLQIGIDVIRARVGGGCVTITPAGDVKFGGGKEAYVTLCVDNRISMPLSTITRGYICRI